jgi:hypothetical protein
MLSYKIFSKDILTRIGILGKKDLDFGSKQGEKESPPFRE